MGTSSSRQVMVTELNCMKILLEVFESFEFREAFFGGDKEASRLHRFGSASASPFLAGPDCGSAKKPRF